MGASLYFPAIYKFFKCFFQRGILWVFYSWCKFKKKKLSKKFAKFFLCQKIEQKDPGEVPVATASFFGGKFLSFGSFSKK